MFSTSRRTCASSVRSATSGEYPGPGRLQLIGAGRNLVLTARHDPEQRTVFRNGPRHRLPDLPVSAHSGYERNLSFEYACHLNVLLPSLL